MPRRRKLPKDFKEWRTAELRAHLRAEDRKELRKLRARLRAAEATRRAATRKIVTAGKRYRRLMRTRWKELRAEARRRVNAQIDAERAAMRARYAERKRAIVAEHADLVSRARALLLAEREEQAKTRAELGRIKRALAPRATAREARAESDDAVRANIPAELHPVFAVVRTRIKPSARMTRTERFFQWVEEHPNETLRIQSEQAEAGADKLIREHEAAERAYAARLKKSRARSRQPRAELEAELSAIPF